MKDTKLYVLQSHYQQNTNKNYQNFLAKDLKHQCIGVNIKQKVRIKNALVQKNQDDKAKRFKAQRYYLRKGIINNFNVIINGKTFYEQPINSDLKLYEELIKLKTGQGKDCTEGCLLDYEYIKNYYRLIVVDLGRQK